MEDQQIRDTTLVPKPPTQVTMGILNVVVQHKELARSQEIGMAHLLCAQQVRGNLLYCSVVKTITLLN